MFSHNPANVQVKHERRVEGKSQYNLVKFLSWLAEFFSLLILSPTPRQHNGRGNIRLQFYIRFLLLGKEIG